MSTSFVFLSSTIHLIHSRVTFELFPKNLTIITHADIFKEQYVQGSHKKFGVNIFGLTCNHINNSTL